MRHVHTAVFKYISEVRSDLCIGDVSEDVSDIVYYAYREKPEDPEVVKEMLDIWQKLRETEDENTNSSTTSNGSQQESEPL